jgi:hypothetical protein
MDRILKLVYDNWNNGAPIANGGHPALISYLQQNPDKQEETINMFAFRDHNNFKLYIKKHVPTYIDIDKNSILDDDAVYLYPVEIKTALSSIHQIHYFSLKGQEYSYTLKDTIDPTILNYINQGKIKLLINFIHDPINHISDIEDIETYFESNGINPSNVILVSGNSFKSYNGRIKIYRGHLFEQQAAEKMLAYPHMSSLGYLSDNVKPTDLNFDVIFKLSYLRLKLCDPRLEMYLKH